MWAHAAPRSSSTDRCLPACRCPWSVSCHHQTYRVPSLLPAHPGGASLCVCDTSPCQIYPCVRYISARWAICPPELPTCSYGFRGGSTREIHIPSSSYQIVIATDWGMRLRGGEGRGEAVCGLSPATVRHGLCSLPSAHDLPAHDRQAGKSAPQRRQRTALRLAGVAIYMCTCGLDSTTARTAPRPRFAVSRSAAARRGPLDLRTRRVRQIRRATSASCTAGSATAVRAAHSRPSRRLWCDRSVWLPGVRMACRAAIVRSRRVACAMHRYVRRVAPAYRG